MVNHLSRRLAPDALWRIVQPLAPPAGVRTQGGGRGCIDDRQILAAIIFVVTGECSWRQLPPLFGVKVSTVHRRFREWTRIGLWEKVDESIADLDDPDLAAWWGTVRELLTARISAGATDCLLDHNGAGEQLYSSAG
ncbi:transposase [Saccharothrix hoggarensis]|uniref:Transposase n=1 Tax=Saccharothrix hoggarensis TaxID=913853 RepID=A0ABW3R1E2_9PSEU